MPFSAVVVQATAGTLPHPHHVEYQAMSPFLTSKSLVQAAATRIRIAGFENNPLPWDLIPISV